MDTEGTEARNSSASLRKALALLALLAVVAEHPVSAGGLAMLELTRLSGLNKSTVPITDMTITDPEQLQAEFAAIRRRGYAIDDRGNEPEVRCAAAPIFGHDDHVVAALSVSSLSSRMTTKCVRKVGPMATETSLRISAKLGSRRANAKLAKLA